MKSITRIARRLMLVFLALVASSTMFFSSPAVAASVDVAATQYLADATTQTQTLTPGEQTQTLTPEEIDEAIAFYRQLKVKVSKFIPRQEKNANGETQTIEVKGGSLTIDEGKGLLFAINTVINELLQVKKAA
ncbi:hypothetical protein SD81_004190 [Tolypothrix campylonemoides VB511288]|nr:hypothetical protein SD81_004190 [Tolypothrix campylonemoides VB511288]